jgi:hypothetical protein
MRCFLASIVLRYVCNSSAFTRVRKYTSRSIPKLLSLWSRTENERKRREEFSRNHEAFREMVVGREYLSRRIELTNS